jgi:hypothetical protein
MKTSLRGIVGIVFVMLALGSCSTGPAIVNEWHNPAYPAGYFRRIMVGGPAGETSVRRNIEDEFLARLRAAGIDALPSYQYIPEDEKIDENNLKQAAQKAGADALLFARTVRVEAKTQGPSYFPYTWLGFFSEHFGISWSGPSGASVYRYNEYTSETTLYDIPKNEVVWTGTIKATEPENARTALKSSVEAVMKALDEKNLVRERK